MRRWEKYFRPHPPPVLVRLVRERAARGGGETSGDTTMQEPCGPSEKNWVLGVASLASFMMALDAQIITTAFATIRDDFGASVETLQWTVNAFNLTFAVLLLTGAALGDRLCRRRMFAAGIALFVLASVACALAGSAGSFIAALHRAGVRAFLVFARTSVKPLCS